ncbi:MAG: hypothetical protein OEM59_19275 [Rhodospirillales bacterium]|nr:hypothetical protein [Rhodospirillales bacterium]
MAAQLLAVVLHGAAADRPDEADTLVQAEEVAGALERLGWRAEIRALGRDLRNLERLLAPRPELIFNLVEAIGGDGSAIHRVPEMLRRLGIPFTGASSRAVFVTTRKPLAKRRMRSAGLPTPDWIEELADPVTRRPGERFIVKSTCEDASLGIDAHSVVPLAWVRAEAAARAARFGGEWFAEAYVEGREFNLGLLEADSGLDVLPIAEILFDNFPADRPPIVDYESKWVVDSFAYQNTPRRFDFSQEDAALLERLRTLARRAFRLFDLGGYARVDFRVDGAGQPWILEVNANPCLAPDAGFMAAAHRVGLTFDQVVERIVRRAGAHASTPVA